MSREVLTLSQQNLFSFTCPVMNINAEMRACVYMRDQVYAGKRPQIRRGCQACITASKCPVAEIVRRFAFGSQDATDHCASLEQKHGKLPADVLERIAPVIITEATLAAYSVVVEERELIATSRERIEQQILTAPREKVEPRRVSFTSGAQPTRRGAQKPAQRASSPETTDTTSVSKAAVTGDLAAALNA